MPVSLTLALLKDALGGNAVAVRRIQRLEPAGGAGDKVFPPTYEGGQYATERRRVGDQTLNCVLLDSVQSQANRIEQAIKQACYRGFDTEADVPVVGVDFRSVGLAEVGDITSLDAPHRLADAILRDSRNGDVPFRQSPEGQLLDTATLQNATGLYGICPTALVFGLWDSTGPRGGLGTKFQRALVSEIVGVDVEAGVKTSSRLDPLAIQRGAADIFRRAEGEGWTLDPSKAALRSDKPEKYGKEGKPSEINHGNVTPSLAANAGGVTLRYAQQSVVLSLPALRRLQFPDNAGQRSGTRDLAARVALTVLALAGAQWAIEQGCDLRSRCLLIPAVDSPATWELVRGDGVAESFQIDDAMALLREANQLAAAQGLPTWRRFPLKLTPEQELVELVNRSRQLATAAAEA